MSVPNTTHTCFTTGDEANGSFSESISDPSKIQDSGSSRNGYCHLLKNSHVLDNSGHIFCYVLRTVVLWTCQWVRSVKHLVIENLRSPHCWVRYWISHILYKYLHCGIFANQTPCRSAPAVKTKIPVSVYSVDLISNKQSINQFLLRHRIVTVVQQQ